MTGAFEKGITNVGFPLLAESNTTVIENQSSVEPQLMVVGIGASAGGIEALEIFFKTMPASSGLAFVVLQHLSPDFKSIMNELLGRCTPMPVRVVENTAVLLPNTVYLVPPRKDVLIENNTLVVHDYPSSDNFHLPINAFFSTLARSHQRMAIAIVLSGTGSDGSGGIVDIHEHGGFVIVQKIDSAQFDGMPRHALQTGCANAVLTPAEMPTAIMQYRNSPHRQNSAPITPQPIAESTTQDPQAIIMLKLQEVYGVDFTAYKQATITRRIERRVSLSGLSRLQNYCDVVLIDAGELDLLYKDLLIGVTEFFRDAEAFTIIENVAIPTLLQQIPDKEEIRLWTPGCSTGEEAYSLAILFLEAYEKAGRTAKLKIIASDLDREALQCASEGVYSAAAIENITPYRLERFFLPQADGTYRVTNQVRKLVIFSAHNLIEDPLFIRVDMIVCRNLLIYLRQNAQAEVLRAFSFALKRDGFLFLGPSEGLGEMVDEFEAIDRQWKIFRKKTNARPLPKIPRNLVATPRHTPQNNIDSGLLRTYDLVLGKYISSGILINQQREIVHIFGDVGRYLHFSAGRPSQDILNLLEGELRLAASSAIQSALKQKEQVIYQHIHTVSSQGECIIRLTVDFLEDKHNNTAFIMLMFEQENLAIVPEHSEKLLSFKVGEEVSSRIQQLEQELQTTKAALQTAIEQRETSNEELQATNEELLASNEELQSTNEELHSVNEELYSVNIEHEAKIKALNVITSDLHNLIQATNVGLLFLAINKTIRLFTPEATRVFNLLPQDIGRDIRHITSRVTDDDLINDIEKVIQSCTAIFKKISTQDGVAFMRKISPYFDLDKNIAGIVIYFVDITELMKVETELFNQSRLLENITDNLPSLVAYWNRDLHCKYANQRLSEWFNLPENEVLGKHYQAVLGDDNFALLEGRIHDVLDGNRQDFEQALELTDDYELPCLTNLIPDIVDNEVIGFIELTTDISVLKRAIQAKDEFVANVSHELRTPLNVVLGMAQLLALENLSEEQLSYLHDLQVAGKSLLEIINDILDFSKIDAGKMTFDIQNVSLSALVDDLRSILSSLAQQKNIKWEVVANLDKYDFYRVDNMKLQRVIVNLISNAVKFTQQGQVSLSIKLDPISEQQRLIHFSVQDTGIGIPLEFQPSIFSAFSQADASVSRRFGGTGLGLAISKKIVDLMGGSIGFSSQQGKGSEFWVRIPLPLGENPIKNTLENPVAHADSLGHQFKQARLSGLTILVVDDFQPNRILLGRLIMRAGGKTVEAENGKVAVDYLRTQAHTVDGVLMDVQMPVLDGLAATRLIRDELQLHELPVIAITAGVSQDDRQKALDAGVNAFITKPIDMVQALQEIEQQLGRN